MVFCDDFFLADASDILGSCCACIFCSLRFCSSCESACVCIREDADSWDGDMSWLRCLFLTVEEDEVCCFVTNCSEVPPATVRKLPTPEDTGVVPAPDMRIVVDVVPFTLSLSFASLVGSILARNVCVLYPLLTWFGLILPLFNLLCAAVSSWKSAEGADGSPSLFETEVVCFFRALAPGLVPERLSRRRTAVEAATECGGRDETRSCGRAAMVVVEGSGAADEGGFSI